MGLIQAEIELVSAEDVALARKGYISEKAIKRKKVNSLVDTGAYMLCINEHIKNQLDLPVVNTMEAELADGSLKQVDVVGSGNSEFQKQKDKLQRCGHVWKCGRIAWRHSNGRYGCCPCSEDANNRCEPRLEIHAEEKNQVSKG